MSGDPTVIGASENFQNVYLRQQRPDAPFRATGECLLVSTAELPKMQYHIQSIVRGCASCAAGLLVAASIAAPAHAAAGWQSISTENVATGQVDLQLGDNCPTQFPVAHSGAFAMNAAGQTSAFSLSFNGPRVDIPSFAQWAWHYHWPNGAPAGVTILYDVYCAKK